MAEDRTGSRAAERRFTRDDSTGAREGGAAAAGSTPPAAEGATERREVRSEDPSLSAEANRLLTGELRQVVGKREVEVPAGRPHRAQEAHATHSKFVASLLDNRPVIIVTFLVALVVGVVISLSTDSYSAVIIALGVHALATVCVIFGAVQLTTEQEHVAPETAALLEREGVADPDRVLTDLVEDFAGATEARGATEVLAGGHNERTVGAEEDPAKAMVEQRTAMTPQSRPGPAAGRKSAVAALPWFVVSAIMVFTLVVAAVLGGEMWLLPLI